MAEDNKLDKFGFEPLDGQEEENLSKFGFEPLDEQEEENLSKFGFEETEDIPESQDVEEGIDLSNVKYPIGGAAVGGVTEMLGRGLAGGFSRLAGPLTKEQFLDVKEEADEYKTARTPSQILQEYVENVRAKQESAKGLKNIRESLIRQSGLSKEQLEAGLSETHGEQILERVPKRGKKAGKTIKSYSKGVKKQIDPVLDVINKADQLSGQQVDELFSAISDTKKSAPVKAQKRLQSLLETYRGMANPEIEDLSKEMSKLKSEQDKLIKGFKMKGGKEFGDKVYQTTEGQNILRNLALDPEKYKGTIEETEDLLTDVLGKKQAQEILKEGKMSGYKDLLRNVKPLRTQQIGGVSLRYGALSGLEQFSGKIQEKTALAEAARKNSWLKKLPIQGILGGAALGAGLSNLIEDDPYEAQQAAGAAVFGDPVRVGKSGTLVEKMESGEPLTPKERQQLLSGDAEQIESDVDRGVDVIKRAGRETAQELIDRLDADKESPQNKIQDYKNLLQKYIESYPEKFKRRVEGLKPQAQDSISTQLSEYANPEDTQQEAKAEYNIQQQPALKRLLEKRENKK